MIVNELEALLLQIPIAEQELRIAKIAEAKIVKENIALKSVK
jgi:hypothetical protein